MDRCGNYLSPCLFVPRGLHADFMAAINYIQLGLKIRRPSNTSKTISNRKGKSIRKEEWLKPDAHKNE
jgi:hypothetical protein